MTTLDILPKVEAALQALPGGLRDHVGRVRAVARELARATGARRMDESRVDLASAAHDLARALSPEALLAEARRLGIPPGPVEQAAPILLHGPVGAEWLRQDMGVRDEEVLEAVRWHTTARPGMSPLAQVVFLADKLEPDKVAQRPTLQGVFALATRDPAQAIAACLTAELVALLQRGMLLHPVAVEARNYFLLLAKSNRGPRTQP